MLCLMVARVCKCLQVDTRGCIYTLGTRSAHTLLILHMHECLRLFMDEIVMLSHGFCIWMYVMCTHVEIIHYVRNCIHMDSFH